MFAFKLTNAFTVCTQLALELFLWNSPLFIPGIVIMGYVQFYLSGY